MIVGRESLVVNRQTIFLAATFFSGSAVFTPFVIHRFWMLSNGLMPHMPIQNAMGMAPSIEINPERSQ